MALTRGFTKGPNVGKESSNAFGNASQALLQQESSLRDGSPDFRYSMLVRPLHCNLTNHISPYEPNLELHAMAIQGPCRNVAKSKFTGRIVHS